MRNATLIIISNAKNEASKNLTQGAINSALASLYKAKLEIIVIEKGMYNYDDATTHHRGDGFNFNKYANYGVNCAKYDNVIISKADVIFHKGSIDEMLAYIDLYNVVSPRCPNDETTNLSRHVKGIELDFHFATWCFMIKKNIWKEIGKFRENFPYWFSDNVIAQQLKMHKCYPTMLPKSHVENLRALINPEIFKALRADAAKKYDLDIDNLENDKCDYKMLTLHSTKYRHDLCINSLTKHGIYPKIHYGFNNNKVMLKSEANNTKLNGIAGCFVSHLNMWQNSVHDGNSEWVVFFEDDFEANTETKNNIDVILHSVPENYDMCVLGGYTFNTTNIIKDINEHLVEYKKWWGLACYAIRRKNLPWMIEVFEAPVFDHVDLVMDIYNHKNVIKVCNAKNIVGKLINNVDTSVQKAV